MSSSEKARSMFSSRGRISASTKASSSTKFRYQATAGVRLTTLDFGFEQARLYRFGELSLKARGVCPHQNAPVGLDSVLH